MHNFTSAEYAAAHGLDFDPNSRAHQKRLAKHLRDLGYSHTVTKRGRRSVRVWRRAINPAITSLDAQLRQIEATHSPRNGTEVTHE